MREKLEDLLVRLYQYGKRPTVVYLGAKAYQDFMRELSSVSFAPPVGYTMLTYQYGFGEVQIRPGGSHLDDIIFGI